MLEKAAVFSGWNVSACGQRYLHSAVTLLALGSLFLASSSLDASLCLVFLACGPVRENVSFLAFRCYLACSRPPYYAQRVTLEEYERIGAATTARELAKLRDYLNAQQSAARSGKGDKSCAPWLRVPCPRSPWLLVPWLLVPWPNIAISDGRFVLPAPLAPPCALPRAPPCTLPSCRQTTRTTSRASTSRAGCGSRGSCAAGAT